VSEKKKKWLPINGASLRHMAILLALLFVIVYLVAVVATASDFFSRSADANALLALEGDLAAADREAERHFAALGAIASQFAEADTKAEVDAIIKDYIGSDAFGDLRYYAEGKTYAPDGSEVANSLSVLETLSAARTRGVSAVYFDGVVEKDCIAFYLPVSRDSYADGILSILPARNLLDMSLIRAEDAPAVALVTFDGKVLGADYDEGFDEAFGIRMDTFLAFFTSDPTAEKAVLDSLSSGERTSVAITALGGDGYRVTTAPVRVLDGNAVLVSFRPVSTLIEGEMTFIRHIVVVLMIAVAAFVASLVYSYLYHRQSQKALSDATLYDAVLECPNAEHFRRRATEVVYSERRQFGVMVLSLRRYHLLVESFGEGRATEALRFAVKVMESLCSQGEGYGYAGDGKFLLLYHYQSEKNLKDRLRLLETLANRSESLREAGIHLRFHIGVFLTGSGRRRTVPEMIECATMASEGAKRNIRLPYVLYTEEVNREMAQNERIEAQMEDSLKNGEFKLFLQPKYNVKHDRIDSAEALVRWFDPERGEYRFPGAFIGLFETNGFIVKLDQFIYTEVLRYFSTATEHGDPVVPISVNVSRVTAMSEDFLDFYVGKKKQFGVADGFLTLELTESFAMENYERIREIVNELHKNGIRCSVDDFGSGYSSFNIIKHIPFDELKIDRIFLESGLDRNRDDAIIKTVIDLARTLNLSVVQEGVETEEMFRRVVDMGCDVIQGYYYAKALPLEEYRLFVNSNTSIRYKAKVK
jgi:EAL domain-containing protein (putative c-di-GMP-specific phosphodiesterase class I)